MKTKSMIFATLLTFLLLAGSSCSVTTNFFFCTSKPAKNKEAKAANKSDTDISKKAR